MGMTNNANNSVNHYLQVGGTAMGTRLAPSYANIFMGRLEQNILKTLETKGLKPALYLRYIDDIFIILNQGEEKLLEFINYFNEAHPSIKFTFEYSKEQITFLDTRVKIDETSKTVFTDLYTKDTDTHNYLHYTSAHPAHCKTGGPFGEFFRIRRNCHKLTDFDRHANARMTDYIRWGYPKTDIEGAKDKARQTKRETALLDKKNTKSKNQRIPLILAFNPANQNMNKIIEKHWHLIGKCINKDVFLEKPLITYRRNKKSL